MPRRHTQWAEWSQEAAQPVYLLAWIPESLLNEKGQSEWDKFVKIEEHAVQDDEEEGAFNYIRFSNYSY